MTNRTSLNMLLLLALLAWAALLIFTHFVPPQSVQAYVTFFVLLGVALMSTFSPLAYFISLRFLSSRLHRATMRNALREGSLVSLWVVFNLLLRALHSWSLFVAIVSLGIIIVVEVLSLGRK
ncbi:MAG TPA: hypothetical protein VE843_00865 [Ktedonobacteraceae bacterium]|nr:hypothetical protein [Ktedonobacteraceae bacterium]